MTNPIIRVENLSKAYRIGAKEIVPTGALGTVKQMVKSPFKYLASTLREPAPEEMIWALKDVSFEVYPGEVVGIIGRNGAGKSTLLKILSRITKPTSGFAEIRGRVASLLEVGTGFHPELTGRENVYLNGTILGMTKGEVDAKFDEIVDFSGVEKFIDTPVKRYSSGMQVRLAFAVAAHLEPEILILDEVLAVGDAQFQKKCLGKMEDVSIKEGRTILFVSHNISVVKALCNQAVLLEQGKILSQGLADVIADLYLTKAMGEHCENISFKEKDDLRIQFLYAEVKNMLDSDNQDIVLFRCKYIVRQEINNVLLCVEVLNNSDLTVFYSNDDLLSDQRKRKKGIHWVSLMIPKNLLTQGNYFVAFGFWQPGHTPEHFPKERLFFQRDEPINRLSSHGIKWPGLLYLPSNWSYESYTS